MNGSFYDRIVPYYDEIFRLSRDEQHFHSSLGIDERASVLDIGCGTGSLAAFLAPLCSTVTGIDLNARMTDRARVKCGNATNVEIVTGDVAKIDAIFAGRTFDFVFCMGNTLVHLGSRKEMSQFLENVHALLVRRGVFVCQILNYDALVFEQGKELPIIENGSVLFRRSYQRRAGTGRIVFRTVLEVKATGEMLEQETMIYPVPSDDLAGMFRAAGFVSVGRYGGFSNVPFERHTSTLLIEVCSSGETSIRTG